MNSKEKKFWLFGIFYACPLKTAMSDCPFHSCRKLSYAERWEVIDKLTDDEVKMLITCHSSCLYAREMKRAVTSVNQRAGVVVPQ